MAYCDFTDGRITEVAQGLRTSGDRSTAVAAFELVRDEVLYAFGRWDLPASSTLATRRGMCTTKANLVVALLRACGIPACYGVLEVDASRYFGAIVPDGVTLGGDRSVHVYAAGWLEGRWVKCDPSADRAISEATAHFCSTTTLVHWDGRTDAMDVIAPEHIHRDLGLMSDLDHLVDRSPRPRTERIARLSNAYLDFARDHPGAFGSAEELAKAFLASGRAGDFHTDLEVLADPSTAARLTGS